MGTKRRQNGLISTGTTSIVLIFVLLSMLTFAVLSLVSAQANLRLSEKSAQRTADYYAAENAANDVLLALNDAIAGAVPAADDAAGFCAAVRAAAPAGVQFPADDTLYYEVPLGEEQVLAVTLQLCWPAQADGSHYTITAWQAVTRYDWQADTDLDVYVPGTLPAG